MILYTNYRHKIIPNTFFLQKYVTIVLKVIKLFSQVHNVLCL